MRRVFVDSSAISGGEIIITDPSDIRHLTKVLRLDCGAFLDVSDSTSYEYRVEIISIEREEIVCRIHDKQSFSKEPVTQVTLYQGIPKQGKMENIIQKSVELGVHRVVPVFLDRTVVVEKGNFDKKLDRWQKVADEAVKQCRRGLIPQVSQPLRFLGLVEEVTAEGAYDLVLFLYENEERTSIKQVLRKTLCGHPDDSAGQFGTGPRSVAILVGPEGGFSDEEARTLRERAEHCPALFCATLGKTILRTETAGPAALAMVMYELELEG